MSQSVNAPPTEYPNPKPVLTATAVGFDPNLPWKIVLVRLNKPQDAARPFVLPGGIFDVGKGRHLSQLHVAEEEFREEVGTRMVWVEPPEQFAISNRLTADPRYWCSCPTVMGANDCIVGGPVRGEIAPNDTEEVGKAFWADVRLFDADTVGRGHALILRVWKLICEHGGFTGGVLRSSAFQDALTLLSDSRWMVHSSQLTGMIYLSDAVPVLDDRPLLV